MCCQILRCAIVYQGLIIITKDSIHSELLDHWQCVFQIKCSVLQQLLKYIYNSGDEKHSQWQGQLNKMASGIFFYRLLRQSIWEIESLLLNTSRRTECVALSAFNQAKEITAVTSWCLQEKDRDTFTYRGKKAGIRCVIMLQILQFGSASSL